MVWTIISSVLSLVETGGLLAVLTIKPKVRQAKAESLDKTIAVYIKIIDDLSQKVTLLQSQNTRLEEKIDSMKEEFDRLLTENKRLNQWKCYRYNCIQRDPPMCDVTFILDEQRKREHELEEMNQK